MAVLGVVTKLKRHYDKEPWCSLGESGKALCIRCFELTLDEGSAIRMGWGGCPKQKNSLTKTKEV